MLLKRYHVIILLAAISILIMLLLLGFQLLGLGLSLRSPLSGDDQLVSSKSSPIGSISALTGNNSASNNPTPSPHQASLSHLLSQSSANQNSYKQPITFETSQQQQQQQQQQPSAFQNYQDPSYQHQANQVPQQQHQVNPGSQMPSNYLNLPSDYPIDHYQASQQPANTIQQQHPNHNPFPPDPFYDPELRNHNPFSHFPAQFRPPPQHHTHFPPIPPAPHMPQTTTAPDYFPPPPLPSHESAPNNRFPQHQDRFPTDQSGPSDARHRFGNPYQGAQRYPLPGNPIYQDMSHPAGPLTGATLTPIYSDPHQFKAGPPPRLEGAPRNKNNSIKQINLLAEPEQQQRHRQEMLDPHYLFNKRPLGIDYYPQSSGSTGPSNGNAYGSNSYQQQDPRIASQPVTAPPPYAHPSISSATIISGADLMSQDQPIRPPSPLGQSNSRTLPNQAEAQSIPGDVSRTQTSLNNQLANGSHVKSNYVNPQQQNHLVTASSQTDPIGSQKLTSISSQQVPLCAGLTNISSLALVCHEDPEYPTKEIMRALELWANGEQINAKSLDQLLPQSLIWLHLNQQNARISNNNLRSVPLPSLDPLQKSLTQSQSSELFPSGSYSPLCRSSIFMSQPRRAKNILGQWKVIVNLPGHKYRGTAISQMLRVEECTKPMGDCFSSQQQQFPINSGKGAKCLQGFDTHRLLAWSRDQGLHMDLFRVPTICSCHLLRDLR